MAAVIHGTPQMVKALLDAGAKVNVRNKLGKTAVATLATAQLPDAFDQLIHPSDRRYVRERQQILQILVPSPCKSSVFGPAQIPGAFQ